MPCTLAAISADSASLSASGGATVGQPKAELHQMVDRLSAQAVDGAAILLGEMTEGRIDPEQAWLVLGHASDSSASMRRTKTSLLAG
jgi:hypothetical protein